MSKAEILQALPLLTLKDREEIRLKLAEMDGIHWLDQDDPLTGAEKLHLDQRLMAYEKDPEAGSSWNAVEARIHARLKP